MNTLIVDIQRATVNKSRLNRAFNRVRIVFDNELMKDWQTSKEQKFHHSVYVVLLDDAVAKHPSILRVNPTRDPLKPCVYVGLTGLSVDHRFENQERLRITLGFQEIRCSIDARTIQTHKSNALRGGGPDGN
jgi:hypothetical protein